MMRVRKRRMREDLGFNAWPRERLDNWLCSESFAAFI